MIWGIFYPFSRIRVNTTFPLAGILFLLLLSPRGHRLLNSSFFRGDKWPPAPARLTVEPPQMAVPGDFLPPFTFLNNLPPGGLDLDNDNQADIIAPCSCRSYQPFPSGQLIEERVFDDQVIIATGVSGQTWRVAAAANLLFRASRDPVPVGTIIPEIGQTGIYVLQVAHLERVGYFVVAEAPLSYPGQEFGPVLNTCYYPDAVIDNLGDLYCDNDPVIILNATVTSGFDGNAYPLEPLEEYWTITRLENGVTTFGSSFSPVAQGGGHYRIRYTFVGPGEAHTSPNKTGCSVTVEKEVYVRPTIPMVCNGSLNLTINPNLCEAEVVPDIVLAGTPASEDFYTVDVRDAQGNLLGNTIPGTYAGRTVVATVTDECTGLSCSAQINVFDFTPPALTVPPDRTIPCDGNYQVAATGMATATDCTPVNLTHQDQWVETMCGNPKVRIFRTWTATDAVGNTTSKVQTIAISRATQSSFTFPPDRSYSCEQYQADPFLTNAQAGKAGVPTLVENPLCGLIFSHSDDTLGICGNPATSFIIIRTWTVLDACGFSLYTTDGAGNDNIQLIRVLDASPPQVSAPPVSVIATLSPLDNGLGSCSSLGFIPPPLVNDPCNSVTVRIFTAAGELQYANGIDGAAGGTIPAPGLTLGTHPITYEATDACGNKGSFTGQVTVVDGLPPMMICNSQLTVTLNSGGRASVNPGMIDEGTRDDCCLDRILLKLQDEPASAFRNQVDLFCGTDTAGVVLRAWDCVGNINECLATVTIRDVQPPVVVSKPPSLVLSCLSEVDNYYNPDFDAPVFADNCALDIEFFMVDSLNDCGAGRLIRTWVASDGSANPPAVATQTLVLEDRHEYTIDLPADAVVDCDAQVFPSVTFESAGCDLITATVISEDVFPDEEGIYCHRIRRIHQVINWCEYQEDLDPLVLPRLDGPDADTRLGDAYTVYSDGQDVFLLSANAQFELLGPSSGSYRYTQLIFVADTEAPSLSAQLLPPACAEENTCRSSIALPFEVSDNCSGDLQVTYLLRLDAAVAAVDTFGQLIRLETGFRIEGRYPPGNHAFVVSVTDACGNTEPVELPFTIEDCTPPVLECLQGKVVVLDSTDQYWLKPEELVELAVDQCSVAGLSFEENESRDSVFFDCDSLGMRSLRVWASDGSGNRSTCSTTVQVEAGVDACLKFWAVSGYVRSETGAGIAQVQLTLDAGGLILEETTNQDGYFEFTDVPQGSDYVLTPRKMINMINGVSTFDLILINKHIQSVQFLDSPFKIIAADANRSGTISILDVIRIRRVILGLAGNFGENTTSWRFVPAEYLFADPLNPFLEAFPESVSIEQLKSNKTFNFTGLKVGDVNGNAVPGI